MSENELRAEEIAEMWQEAEEEEKKRKPMEWLDKIKEAEYERGYRAGMNAVIVNVERLLKEIKP